MPGPSSPFSLEERIFIVNKFAELKSISDVKRVFRLRLYPKNPRAVPTYMAFQRVVNKFGSCGDVGDPKPERLRRNFVPEEDVRAVEDFFRRNEKAHIREAARELNFSFGKVWHILRKVLKWKAYKPHVTTVLSHKQRQARVNAAQWFLSHDAEFFSKQVIWSDEKYFVLKQGPNKSIHRFWAPTNPNIIVECKSQSQQKVMCWSGLCNGEVIGPFWIEGSMNQFVYKKLLEDEVWPLLRHQASRTKLYFMQNGATCHTTQMSLDYLKTKFGNRVISNRTDLNSPDL